MADASSLAGKPQSPFHRIKCRTVPQSPAPDESSQRKPCVIRHKPGDQKRIPRHEVDEPGIASFFIITVFGVDDMSTEVPGKHDEPSGQVRSHSPELLAPSEARNPSPQNGLPMHSNSWSSPGHPPSLPGEVGNTLRSYQIRIIHHDNFLSANGLPQPLHLQHGRYGPENNTRLPNDHPIANPGRFSGFYFQATSRKHRCTVGLSDTYILPDQAGLLPGSYLLFWQFLAHALNK